MTEQDWTSLNDRIQGFTEGEWFLSTPSDSVPWLHIYCGDSMGPWHHSRPDAEKMANSSLIAAAPTLLAEVKALRGALNEIDALDPEQMIQQFSYDALRGLVLRMGEIARAALGGETDV